MELNNKIIEHDVRLIRVEEDVAKLNNDMQNIREKQAGLESVQMVTLEKLGRIEELAKETYNKLEEADKTEISLFEKYKFWIFTGLIASILTIAQKL